MLSKLLNAFVRCDVESCGIIDGNSIKNVLCGQDSSWDAAMLDSVFSLSGAARGNNMLDYRMLLKWLCMLEPPSALDAPELFQDLSLNGDGCLIPLTEDRSITVTQLQVLYSHVDRRCLAEQWRDCTTVSKYFGQLLEPATLNLYQAVAWVVLPATASRCCSLVELMASHPQKPHWFCSHWWGA